MKNDYPILDEDDHFDDIAFEKLVKDGTIHTPPRDAIFDLAKAVLQNNPKLAYELLAECNEIGESKLNIISAIYNNAKWSLQVQTCKSNNVEKSTGLSYWQIKNASTGYYSDEDLEYLMWLCHKIETGVKQGKVEEVLSVDYLLAKFFS